VYQHILIPYDGSDEGLRGAVHGIELAAALGADVTALYVIDLPGVPRALSLRDDEEQLREEYEEYADKILTQIQGIAADEYGVDCETATRSGSPAEEITDYAEDEEMDVVVMASAYRGRIGTLLGGTTDKVVRTAEVPVLTQRMGYEEV